MFKSLSVRLVFYVFFIKGRSVEIAELTISNLLKQVIVLVFTMGRPYNLFLRGMKALKRTRRTVKRIGIQHKKIFMGSFASRILFLEETASYEH